MNKVSITKWETMLQENTVKVAVDGLDGVEMTIKNTLSLQEMMQFVEDVVSSCVDHDSGDFTPQVRGFAIKSEIVSIYANFNVPTDTSKQYDLLYRTNVVKQILPHINMEQFNEMIYAIDRRIEHEARKLESQSAMEAHSLLDRISVLSTQFETIFSSVDVEKVNDMMDSIGKISNMSEDQITNAVLSINKKKQHTDVASNGDVMEFPKSKK